MCVWGGRGGSGTEIPRGEHELARGPFGAAEFSAWQRWGISVGKELL